MGVEQAPATTDAAGRVLVLSSRQVPAQILTDALGSLGYKVIVCSELSEALSAIGQGHADAPVVDHALVDLCLVPEDAQRERPSGLEAVSQIRAHGPSMGIVAFCSAPRGQNAELTAAALAAGADDLVEYSDDGWEQLVSDVAAHLEFFRTLQQRLRRYTSDRDPMLQALQQLGVGIAIVDRHLRVWYMNETLREEMGYPLMVASHGRYWLSCYAQQDAQCPAPASCLSYAARKAIEEKREVQQTALLRVNTLRGEGRRRPALRYYQLTAKPMLSSAKDGRVMAVLETAQDITDTLRTTGMDRRVRLELLARAVLDVGFSRCRIYTRGDGSARRLQLTVFVGGNIDRHGGHEIDLEQSHAAARRGQWEAGAAWFPPGYEREPWHEDLGLPVDHQGWVDWPVFGPAGRLLGWIAADTAPPSEDAPLPACERTRFVGRPVAPSDLEALRMYADHAAQILSASQDADTVEFDREAAAISELDSRVLVSGATPTQAAEWALEALHENLPSLVHSTVRYFSDWTQSAVLFASRGPLEPYLEREVSLYDLRRPSGIVHQTGEPVIHRLNADGSWGPWMKGWLEASPPGFEEALRSNGVVHILIYPLQIEGHPVGSLGLFLSEVDAVSTGAARWLLERALERAQACATAARMQERLRSEAIEQAMPDLLPAIAHKLGTPLFLANQEIRAFDLDVEEGTATVESARTAMANLKRHMSRIDAIRRQFLEMSAAGGRRRQRVDLVSVLREAVSEATEGVSDEFKVLYHQCPERADVNASREDLSEVFYELAANAVRALGGKGELHIEVSPYPASNETPVAWRITFENAGRIPDDDKARIFDPFYTTNLASGTGLGLALVRRLLRANEATIREIGTDSVVFELLVPTWTQPHRGREGEA